MIKQSRTTIKELTAQYRAVLKRAFLAGIATITVVANANAASSITDEDIAKIKESISIDFAEAPDISTYLYDSDGDGSVDTAIDGTTTEVLKSGFTFGFANSTETGDAGSAIAKDDSRYTFEADDGSNTSYNANNDKIDSTKYSWTPTGGVSAGISANLHDADAGATELSQEGYTYTNWNSEVRNISDGAPNPTTYEFTNNAGTTVTLADYATDTGFNIPTDEINNAATALSKYNTDKREYDSAYDIWNTDKTAYTTVAGKLKSDQDKLAEKKSNFDIDSGNLSNAQSLWNTAQNSLTDVNNSYNTALSASSNYENSLGKAVDVRADDAISRSLTEGGAINTKLNTKQDSLDATQMAAVNSGIDSTKVAQIATNATGIETEVNRAQSAELQLTNAINTETTRAQGVENGLQNAINQLSQYAANADARILANANAYTDAQVDTLEKNVSGGVAAATALSAVEVSNVKRGEMSVGGGYGYYNGESAGAFGMALGLSDNWSVNAGAGIASGDKTQMSLRAGTNYKFKLF
ncbi:MAG: YadA-like family protein [Alphaproteobacteria bacterium]